VTGEAEIELTFFDVDGKVRGREGGIREGGRRRGYRAGSF